MDAKNILNLFRNKRLILGRCIKIAAIILILSLVSCSQLRTVRSGNMTVPKQLLQRSKDKEKDNNDEDNKEKAENISENAEESEGAIQPVDLSSNNKINTLASVETDAQKVRRLPTLREQMKMLQEDQTVIKSDVGKLQTDVVEIKETLEDIKNSIRGIRSPSNLTPAKGERPVQQPVKAEAVRKEPVKGGKEILILSDEEENGKSEQPKQESKPKLKMTPKPAAAQPKKKEAKEKPVTFAPAKENPPVKDNRELMSTAELAGEPAEASKAVLTNALEDFSKKDYQEAITKLNNIINKEKSPVIIVECHFWLGESNFGLKQYDKAITYFIKVVNSKYAGEKSDDAQNMIAECNLREGKTPQARKAYQMLIERYPGSEFIPKARKMLQQL